MRNKNTITLNGQSSTEITGLLIQELPPISKPLLRTQTEEIDGRDGDIVTPLGYSAYTKEITIGLYGTYDINQIIAYFASAGQVTFSNEPDKYYNYEIIDQIDFERLVRYRTATVTFHVQPFKYLTDGRAVILDPPADNLLSIPDYTKTTNGVTLSANDGVVSITGTPTAPTEFYLPITALNLTAGSYTLTAAATGANPNYCSIRLIGSAPSNADSFGGKYITLAEGAVTLDATISASKNFGFLWFYMNPGQTFNFTATFEVENNAQKVASGEGSAIALFNTAEAPFSSYDIKGNTTQQTYSGKNLFSGNYAQFDNTGGRGSTYSYFALPSDDVYTLTLIAKSDIPASSVDRYIGFTWTGGSSTSPIAWLWKAGSTATKGEILTRNNLTSQQAKMLYLSIFPNNASNLRWFTERFDIQLEKNSSYTPYEPFVGGTASPNPDFPQEVQVVKNQAMIRLTGKNLVRGNELSLDPGIERTLEGLRSTITSSTLNTYYDGSIANPLGVYTVSFEARNIEPTATLVLDETAGIWDKTGLTLKNEAGEPADLADRTLSGDYKKYSFTVIADTSLPWVSAQAMRLNFAQYVNSPVFELSHFQIELGQNATEFDDSIPQMYPLDFRTGKNLLNPDYCIVGGLERGTPDFTIPYRINNAVAPTKVDPNTAYTISVDLGETVQGMRVEAQECDINAEFIQNNGWQQLASNAYTFTTGANTQYVKLVFSLSTTDATVSDNTEDTTPYADVTAWLRGAKVQMEEGDTATEYEDFESMELCKIGNYQDYITKSGDDWYVHKAVGKAVLDGTEPWQTSVSTVTNLHAFYLTAGYIGMATSSDARKKFCNNFIFVEDEWKTVTFPCLCLNSYLLNDLLIFSGFSNMSSATDWKTWLSTHNTPVYYALATPTDTKITNKTMIQTLENLKAHAHAYKHITLLSSYPVGKATLPPISAVEVMQSSDGLVTNAGNYYSKPRLTIYGSGDIGITLNGEQLFQIALGDNGQITIDTAAMEAYTGTTETLQNRLVTGDYDNFKLQPGDNIITFSGTVTRCIVENYNRWL